MSLQDKPGPFFEQDFYERAKELRMQFEQACKKASESSATLLSYLHQDEIGQMLTVGGEQVFGGDLIEHFIAALGDWSAKSIHANHVSTPQLRVFISGCRRELVRDQVNVRWHYILSLTEDSHGLCVPIKLLAKKPEPRRGVSLNSVLYFKLKFNQLLIHDSAAPYAILPGRLSMNPLQAIVLADGYLW
jgi:hypothetical protein